MTKQAAQKKDRSNQTKKADKPKTLVQSNLGWFVEIRKNKPAPVKPREPLEHIEDDGARAIISIIRDLESVFEQAPRKKVIEAAREYHNLDETTAENLILELLSNGSLYEPRNGVLKSV